MWVWRCPIWKNGHSEKREREGEREDEGQREREREREREGERETPSPSELRDSYPNVSEFDFSVETITSMHVFNTTHGLVCRR